MKNLAGDRALLLAHGINVDTELRNELAAAGIWERCIPVDEWGEVKSSVGGVLNSDFLFRRLWTYWVCRGPVPIAVAQRLYADPIGRHDVRAAGHCGCPPPETQASGGAVWSYHIDSPEGLKLLADTLRELPPWAYPRPGEVEACRLAIRADARVGLGSGSIFDTLINDAGLVSLIDKHDLHTPETALAWAYAEQAKVDARK